MLFLEIPYGSPAYDESIKLRDAILRQPLKLHFFKKDLAAEYDSHHLVCYDDDFNLLACLVMKPLAEGKVKMRQVAVDPNYQNKKIGTRLVDFSEKFSLEKGFTEIVLNARVTAVPFYKRLGYKVYGDLFQEVGIDHNSMKKELKP